MFFQLPSFPKKNPVEGLCLPNPSIPLLHAQADACKALNMALTVMYQSGFWVRSDQGKRLAALMFRFLSLYSKCAEITLSNCKRRFAVTPKLHMMAHCAVDLSSQSRTASWAVNPLAMTNQIQEDFIGRPSRISRRVSVRSIHKSLLMRSLIIYQESLIKADADKRGMDGYSDL